MRISSPLLLLLASSAMMVALIAQSITVASGHYEGLFLVSMTALAG
jgi:hypothetical protein